MDKKKLILLLGALIIAIGTALAARSMFAGAAAPEVAAAPAVPEGPKVLVAKRALPVGTIITADAIGFQLWPQELVQDAYYIDGESDINKLLGTVVRYPITAGQPVTQGALVAMNRPVASAPSSAPASVTIRPSDVKRRTRLDADGAAGRWWGARVRPDAPRLRPTQPPA